MWGGIWGSNPRHPEPQSGALPTELIPPNRPRKQGWYLLSRTVIDDCQIRPCGPDLTVARQEGFEPPTYCLEGSCSILLSYWRRSADPTAQRRPVQAGAGDGNRTHVSSLEGWCSTIELHPHGLFSPKIISCVPRLVKRFYSFFSGSAASFFGTSGGRRLMWLPTISETSLIATKAEPSASLMMRRIVDSSTRVTTQ